MSTRAAESAGNIVVTGWRSIGCDREAGPGAWGLAARPGGFKVNQFAAHLPPHHGTRMKRLSPLFPLLIANALTGPAQAETGYVTDSCTIPIRRGTSTQYKILRMAPSGTPLEIMESSSAEGYTKVKTPEGTVGWILSRYLMDQPAPRDRVVQLEARITTLEEENRGLRGEVGALDTSRAELARCGKELAEIRRAASQTLAIEQENRNLQQETTLAREQVAHLERENASLREESQRDWFIAGAGVGFGGLLLGLIIPNLPWRRQRRRWEQF